MPTLLWIKALSLMVICSVTVNALQNHHRKQDKNLCNYTKWKLVEANITKTVSGVLKKGSGEKKVVDVDVEIDGKYYRNESFVDEDCCEGFERRGKKEKCKPCKHKTYGRNCSEVCNCDGCKKCHHKTGKCDKCEDPTSALTTTTTLAPSTSSDINSTTLENNKNDTFTRVCRICRRFKNCTTSDTKRCWRYKLNRTGQDDSGDSTTILTAVISSLATFTVLILIGFILRERRHRLKKQRLQGTGPVKFSALEERHEYVDPEPVYQEILDEDITCLQNGDVKKKLKKQHSGEYQSPNENLYSPPIERSYQPPGDFAYAMAKPINVDESGYLSPYTPLRFARSETNIYRDRKIQENGDYDTQYSLAKATEKDDDINYGKDNKENEDDKDDDSKSSNENIEVGDQEKLIDPSEHSSQTDVRISDTPVYFVLEKVKANRESQDSEKETQLEKVKANRESQDSEKETQLENIKVNRESQDSDKEIQLGKETQI